VLISAMASASTSQPIAFPAHNGHAGAYLDYQMADSSYTGSSGSFNPASYTRHFLGSPISWRPSSFNAGSFTQRHMDSPLHGSIECVSLLLLLLFVCSLSDASGQC
jgi:transcription factor SFP1